MHKDTFNADFYITAATVIPLLYLALTLQGRTYDRMLSRVTSEYAAWVPVRWSWRSLRQVEGGLNEADRQRFQHLTNKSRWMTFRIMVLQFAAFYIVLSGILGEWLAILAIYKGSSDNGRLILFSLYTLLIAVAVGPVLRFGEPLVAAFRRPPEPFEDQNPEKTHLPASNDSEEAPE